MMKQTTLHHHFHTTYRPEPSISRLCFLDLPYTVRLSIYELAGLIRKCPIDLNSLSVIKDKDGLGCFRRPKDLDLDLQDLCDRKCFHQNKSLWPCYSSIISFISESRELPEFPDLYKDFCADLRKSQRHWDNCDCEPLPYRLLFVSRAISEEVSNILYSTNTFTVCGSRPGGLSPLRRLNSKALASLTALRIQLNACCTCRKETNSLTTKDYCAFLEAHANCDQGSDALLDTESPHGRSVISDWYDTCNTIATNLQPSHLELCFICDTANYQTAKVVLTPLMRLSTLRKCSIRLSQGPNRKLQRLAQIAVSKVTGGRLAEYFEPFRFTDLPEELQQHVPEYTALVAPLELSWDNKLSLPEMGCRWMPEDYSWASCCPFKHAAFSYQCRCWKYPLALFQVSSKVRAHARHVFYPKNFFRFSIYSDQPLTAFLDEFVPRALWRHIRTIKLVFPYDYYSESVASPHVPKFWWSTVGFIVNNLNLPRLNLTLHLPYNIQEVAISLAYEQFMEPLLAGLGGERRSLRTLKNLFIHLTCPYMGDLANPLQQYEQVLERSVMGQHYNSFARGKVPVIFTDD